MPAIGAPAATVARAAGFNRPLLWAKGMPASILSKPLVSAEPANVVVDTIKPAETARAGSCGSMKAAAPRHRPGWHSDRPYTASSAATRWRMTGEAIPLTDGGCALALRPFQIATLRVR
ncbi:MAG: hypothetical protein WDM81_08255 [Rhizomicrobium sp.]